MATKERNINPMCKVVSQFRMADSVYHKIEGLDPLIQCVLWKVITVVLDTEVL